MRTLTTNNTSGVLGECHTSGTIFEASTALWDALANLLHYQGGGGQDR